MTALERYIDQYFGNRAALTVTPMTGGGSCEVFALDRGTARWVLRRAPRHASSSTAHDVLREFQILDAIKDQPVPIARPVLRCADPAVFGSPFYVMQRIDGVPVRSSIPSSWTTAPETQRLALEQLIDALAQIHAVDWRACGLEDMAHAGDYASQQIKRWCAQLTSYQGRELPVADAVAQWLDSCHPHGQSPALTHGDYKLDNVLFATDVPPRLLAVVDWEMASIGDPLVDLAWALIFHPGPDGTLPLGVMGERSFAVDRLPDAAQLVERYAQRTGRDVGDYGWYRVFARWKLAIALEGSYTKFVRGKSDKPVHQLFGQQVELLLASARDIIDRGDH